MSLTWGPSLGLSGETKVNIRVLIKVKEGGRRVRITKRDVMMKQGCSDETRSQGVLLYNVTWTVLLFYWVLILFSCKYIALRILQGSVLRVWKAIWKQKIFKNVGIKTKIVLCY